MWNCTEEISSGVHRKRTPEISDRGDDDSTEKQVQLTTPRDPHSAVP